MRGLVVGTGPSLAAMLPDVRRFQGPVFTPNNAYQDIPNTACWLACDPLWHAEYSPVRGGFDKWHWDRGICEKYGYRYIEGRWFDGLSTDPSWISYNHCSSAQLLNLAVHYGCDEIVLVGHDFHYNGKRHYFDGLSDEPGEYPLALRKHSTFDGLIETYRHIAEQDGLPPIYNATPGSALPWFPMRDFADFL